jgi:hypothetical protein
MYAKANKLEDIFSKVWIKIKQKGLKNEESERDQIKQLILSFV